MIREKLLLTDFGAGTNAEEAAELKWWILDFINRKTLVTADEIYEKSECGDIAMYLALHELVTNELIEGLSPYDDNSPGDHREMQYRRAMNNQAMFFSHAAESMSNKWDPAKWAEGTVLPGDSEAN